MIPVVISDIHSRWNKLTELLNTVGVLDANGARLPGYQLIQVGDAVSAGYGMKEAQFYRDWTDLLEDHDVELVGNHEMPIFSPNSRIRFYGFEKGDGGTDGCDPELIPLVLARQHRYKVAHVANDWLITHAGVWSHYRMDTAQDTADYLNQCFEGFHRQACPCPICNPYYGPLWVRDLEKSNFDPSKVKQIFGHTPDGPTLSKGGTMWNIDTPRITDGTPMSRSVAESYGGVSCLVWNDDKADWENFYVR